MTRETKIAFFFCLIIGVFGTAMVSAQQQIEEHRNQLNWNRFDLNYDFVESKDIVMPKGYADSIDWQSFYFEEKYAMFFDYKAETKTVTVTLKVKPRTVLLCGLENYTWRDIGVDFN